MAYTKEDLIKLNVGNISEAREKIADIRIFDHIDDLSLDDRTLNTVDYTAELYQEYLEILRKFPKTTLEKILRALKHTEVIDNHSLEAVSFDLLRNYQETKHSSAINYLIKKLYSEGGILTPQMLIKTHEILMRGTLEDGETSYLRKNNDAWVGYQDGEERVIEYLPISYDEIKQALKLLTDYCNSKEVSEQELFVKPIIVHALIMTMQMFTDGNSRLGRTMEHLKIFQTTNQLLNQDFTMPTIYLSKSYVPYRQEYRRITAKLAIKPNDEMWNQWILFNLRRIQDQIFANENNLSRVRTL